MITISDGSSLVFCDACGYGMPEAPIHCPGCETLAKLADAPLSWMDNECMCCSAIIEEGFILCNDCEELQ